jgi:membrane protein YdbS with pleckstrin-like domain
VTAGQVDGLVWHKLSLLTPIVLGGRVIVILVLLSAEHAATGVGNGVTIYVELAVLAIFLFVGFVKWWVTKWVLDGTTLRIETGLFKRDARQLPLARIQAVDTVRPFLARILGLAELRVRLAGGGKAGGRLAYLSEPVALDLRARLLAGHHGLDLATPEPAEQSVATVPVGQLVAGALLMPATLAVDLAERGGSDGRHTGPLPLRPCPGDVPPGRGPVRLRGRARPRWDPGEARAVLDRLREGPPGACAGGAQG